MTRTQNIWLRWLIVLAAALAQAPSLSAQIFQTGVDDALEYPLDTLYRKHEWWLGVNGSAYYGMNFGTLTVDITGGTAPNSPKFTVKPQGGYGYGGGGGIALGYRPIFSQLGFQLTSGLEYRYAQAQTTVPIAYDIFAYNAVFEAQSQVLYLASSLSVKVQLGVTGLFATAGLTFDLPLKTEENIVWQRELWDGGPVTNEPGAPITEIKWNTTVKYSPRAGLQVGVGHDFMAGMFGYRSQLITPYVVIQGATPAVFEPTAWNSIYARVGVMWHAGI
jgi:hypothetical protein